MITIGIDLGASHIGIATVDNQKEIMDKKYILFNEKVSNNTLTRIIVKTVYELLRNRKLNIESVEKVGIGLPGGVNIEKGIFYGSNYHMLDIEEFNIKDILQNELQRYVFIENDCNCAILCEANKGILKKYNSGIMFTIGTGLGISIIRKQHNKIILGNESEIKSIIDINDKKYIRSFNRLTKWYEDRIGIVNIKRSKIFEDLMEGSSIAYDTLSFYLDNMIRGIDIVSRKLKIYNICIGGGLSEYEEHYINVLKKRLPNLNIDVAKYKNDSAIIGSTFLPTTK